MGQQSRWGRGFRHLLGKIYNLSVSSSTNLDPSLGGDTQKCLRLLGGFMSFYNPDNIYRTYKSVAMSGLLHIGAVTGITLAHFAPPLQEGMSSSETITITEVSRGQQTETSQVAVVEKAGTDPGKASPAVQDFDKDAVVVQKPKKPKKKAVKKVAAKKKSPPKTLPEKAVVPVVADPEPEAVPVQAIKDAENNALEEVDRLMAQQKPEPAPAMKSDDGVADEIEEIERFQQETEKPKDKFIAEKNVDEKAKSKAEQNLYQTQRQADPRQQVASSQLPPGVPQGTRDWQDLKQRPGNPLPRYPHQARMQRWEGRTTLLYWVTSQGQVKNLKLLRSSGYRVLDKEAIQTISLYRYVPGQAGWVSHNVRYSLRGQATEAPSRLRTRTSQSLKRRGQSPLRSF